MQLFSLAQRAASASNVRFGNRQPSRDSLLAAETLIKQAMEPTGKLLAYSGQRPDGYEVRAVVGHLGTDILITTRAEVTPQALQELTTTIGHLTPLEGRGRMFEYAPPQLRPQTFKVAVVQVQPL